jgi:transketolase
MNNVTQRDVIFNQLYKIARSDRSIVVVAADMSAPSLDQFRIDMPQQFVNVGIAEQNAILIGSGLALEGKKVYVYAISPFITLRCLENIRVSCLIQDIPLTILGMGTGLSYCTDGPTHHLMEDVAVMRAFPGIRVVNLSDNQMAAAYVDISALNKRDVLYIRIDKDYYPDVHKPDTDFSRGFVRLRQGNDLMIVATGPMVHTALDVADILASKKIFASVMDVFEFPFDSDAFISDISAVKKIVTIEEHFLPGGMGSAICEILNDKERYLPVKRMGLSMAQGYKPSYQYGGREVTRRHYGIDKETIYRNVYDYLKK